MDTPFRRLAIRTRRTLSAAGSVETQTTVYCPRRGHSVLLDYCVCCEQCAQVHLDRVGNDSFLLCGDAGAVRWSEAPQNCSYPVCLHEYGLANSPAEISPATQGSAAQTAIHRIMPTCVLCVTADVGVQSLMAMLLDMHISGAPVVDPRGTPVGVVSKTDLVRENFVNGADSVVLDEPTMAAELELESGVHIVPGPSATVADIMTPAAMFLPETAGVARAAAVMSYNGVHRLPVVSNEDTVVGILSASDLLRWLAVGSGYAVPGCARCA